MVTHELKIWPEQFADVVSGAKKYEVRHNDRNFQIDDLLHLREFDPITLSYSGKDCTAKVVHMTRGDVASPVEDLLFEDAVVMGIEVIA